MIPQSTATVAQTLRMNGYSTAWFGKAHITPLWELSPAGPFDRWPTGLGFDRFYGFLGGETSEYEPALYDQTTPVEPYIGREDYHLTEDLTDKTIDWIRLQKTSAPDKPFFVYFAPGAGHCPHHVWPEWSEKFRGQFDNGWDALRERIFECQLAGGIIPEGTTLTPRPPEIPSWTDYDDRHKPVASRLMEVFAGFIAHTDAQVGRVIDAIDELGQWDNTLFVYIFGDNGASAEGTVHGCWSAPAYQNGLPEEPEWLLAHIDDFSTVRCENHYNVGWAWAPDAPFPWMKQVASHFGGTRNGMAISWPRGISAAGQQRSQFHHVIDIAPTILDAAGIPHPERLNGIEQQPIEGVSMRYSFDDAAAPSTRTTQYFDMFGNRAIYHDGWIASCFHGRLPWVRTQALPFGETERWKLYNVTEDFSQGVDLAGRFPDKLTELRRIFDREARVYNVYPLNDETNTRALPERRPSLLEGVTSTTYFASHVRIPELSTLNFKNTSFDLTARVAIPAGGAFGVIICQGGSMAGWTLYLRDGIPHYTYNYLGYDITTIKGQQPLGEGPATVSLSFDYDGGGLGKGGTATLGVDGTVLASGRVERTVPFLFSMSGETIDVGVDTGSPVGPYPAGFAASASWWSVSSGRNTTSMRSTDPVNAGQLRGALGTQ